MHGMASHSNGLSDLEKRRVELEENVAKLQASLRHWQAWEIEYEGLKEEILELGDEPTSMDIDNLLDDSGVSSFESSKTLLTRKERFSLLRNDKGAIREPSKILNVLSRRVDYVQENIKNVTSLLSAAQKELLASDVLQEAKALNEDGLPLTEIHEELDEDGNIISSSTSMPGEAARESIKAIEEAAGAPTNAQIRVKPAAGSSPKGVINPVEQSSVNVKQVSRSSPKRPVGSAKERVSFAEDVQEEEVSALETAQKHKLKEQKLLQEISDREADELERREMAESVIPEDESAEDAALRRQMIQYNMDEVGAVVAEIDLEDDILSQSEYDSEIEIDKILESEGEDEDEEDEFGRTSASQPLDSAYVSKMQALSDQLKANAMINIGPDNLSDQKDDTTVPDAEEEEAAARTNPKVSRRSAAKKGVRFADDLEIQEAPKASPPPAASERVQEAPEVSMANILAASSAMSGTPILQPPGMNATETAAAANPPIEPTIPPPKVSKFKAARAQQQASSNARIASPTINSTPVPTPTPTPAQTRGHNNNRGPSRLLADTLVERPFSTSTPAHAPPPRTNSELDPDLDPDLLHPQLSTAYHHLRNRQIQREGGFLRDDDDDDEEYDDDDGNDNNNNRVTRLTEGSYNEEDGQQQMAGRKEQKKISRFKAARLGLQK